MPSLEGEGRRQVYDADRTTQEELKRLNKSIIHKFLELLDFLANDPSKSASKVEELELLFVNFHFLLNGFRTHQARQTLISWLEEQLQRRSQALETIRQLTEQANSSISESKIQLSNYSTQLLSFSQNNENQNPVMSEDHPSTIKQSNQITLNHQPETLNSTFSVVQEQDNFDNLSKLKDFLQKLDKQ
jgi:hypothetical protein